MADAKDRIRGIRERLEVAVSRWDSGGVVEDTQALCGALNDVLGFAVDTKDWELVETATNMLSVVSTATSRADLEDAHDTLVEDLDILEELYTRKPSESIAT